jgi:hypothetical protein
MEDDVYGMDGVSHVFDEWCRYELVRRKAAGSRSAIVAWAIAPFSLGK